MITAAATKTVETDLYIFTTMGELPEDFTGALELDAVYTVRGWNKVNVTKVEQHVGYGDLTALYMPEQFEEGTEAPYELFQRNRRVRIAK